MKVLVKKANEEMSREWKYEIKHLKNAKSFVDSYVLKVSSVKVEKELIYDNTESIIGHIREHLEKLHESMASAQ